MINQLYNYLINAAIIPQKLPSEISLNIPYFSQWESPKLVDSFLSHQLEAKDDPLWRDSGATSKEEYQYWSWNLCGSACLKMILKFQTGIEHRLCDLGRKITEYGGYIHQTNGSIDGLYYKPFITYMRKEHSLQALVAVPLTFKRIRYEISQGNFVIVSVNPAIRDEKNTAPKTKTGHLVLITGYNDLFGVFYLHNPSGYYKKSQRNHKIKYQDFMKFFSKRGIIIYADNKIGK